MRKFLMSALIAGAAVAAASPAAAQGWGHNNGPRPGQHMGWNGGQIRAQINQLDNSISRAQQRRTISQREATGLRRQTLNLQRQYNQFARNGLDRREVSILQSGVNQVRQNLRMERLDFDRFRG